MLHCKNIIIFVVAIFACTGCTSINPPVVHHQLGRFDNPEVNSQPFHFKASIDTASVMETSLINSDGIKLDYSTIYSFSTSLGKGFEFSAKTDLENYQKYSIKYQFYGAPFEKLQTNGFSHALLLGYSGYRGSDDGAWALKQNTYDLAWLAGYRYSDSVLIYSNLFYDFNNISVDYFNHSSGCQYGCKIGQKKYDDNMFGTSIAIEKSFSKNFFVTGELLHQKSDIFSRNHQETVFNMNVGYRF